LGASSASSADGRGSKDLGARQGGLDEIAIALTENGAEDDPGPAVDLNLLGEEETAAGSLV